ncbi:hypothetical protein AHAS_Ahas18G0227400 [Arachis hypogaea]
MFTLRAALMWTISDFPDLGNLSGWNVHSKYACPTCNFNTNSYRLKHGGKWCFLGHRRFLERGHKFRLSRAKFNGKVELRDSLAALIGSEILEQLESINVSFGKELQASKDVMHIEKNVCDNVLYTLLNETGRLKDNLKARKDLKEMDIRKDLWPDDCVAFPISFEKWSDILASFFENQWNIFFLARFCFKVSDNLAKRFLLQSLGEKWREHRIKLWNYFYDPRLSKTEIINNAPEDIAPDQWALFVEYHLKPETQKLCKRNQEIRQKQIIPHTSGAKSIARRRAELTEEMGIEVSRVQMWDITHKKIDRSYVNEKAKEIAKIEVHSNQQPMESTVNSPLDALGVVFGKEHPGRVRGLGMGVVPTVAFKNNTTRISQMNLGSSNDAGTSSNCGANVQEELDTIKAQLQALVSYIVSKGGGKIPIQLAGMFPTQQVSQLQVRRFSGGATGA